MRRDYPLKRSDDPNVIYGRDFDDMPIELKTVTGEMGEITFRGQVISFDTREIRNEKTIVMFAVTDFTDTIMVKMFTRNDQLPDLLAEIKKGVFLKIKGVTTIDKFDGELTIGFCNRNPQNFGFPCNKKRQVSGKTRGASLPYQDERYGWCFRGKRSGKAST